VASPAEREDSGYDAQERCEIYDRPTGRCQLDKTHSGPHAISIDGAFITWQGQDVHSWAKRKPPAWLVQLPWAEGYEPMRTGQY
jgi:hypothetical protein